jgi:RND family efflux transporter MFP subunit
MNVLLKGLACLVVLGGAPIVGILIARSGDAVAASPPVDSSKPHAPQSPQPVNDLVGVLLPPQMANMSPRSEGRILAVRVKVGQQVKAGTPLVALDPRERQQDLAVAEAQLKAARAEAAGAGAEYAAASKRAARRNATVRVGGEVVSLVSGEEAAQSHFEAQSAAARAASAGATITAQQAKVDLIRLTLQETELTAPFDGVVAGIYFEPGMTVHSGDVVVRVVGGQGLRARIAVPEESAELLHRRRAELHVEGKTLTATIDQVSPEVEPASRSYLVEGSVNLDNAACGRDCSLLAGREVRASLLPGGEL